VLSEELSLQNERSHQLAPPCSILVADDEHHIRAVVVTKLRQQGHEVREAANGEEALEMIRAQPPMLVITDLQMPVMNGLQLCQALRADPRTAGIPVVLVTARGHLLHEDDLGATNVARVISKPFSARELVAVVNSILAGRASGGVAA